MSDTRKIEQNDNEFINLSRELAQHQDSYASSDAFYKQYEDNLSKIGQIFDNLKGFYKAETDRLSQQREQAKAGSKKELEVAEKCEPFTKSKTEEYAKKMKHNDALKSKMKEVLTGLDPKKVAAIPVEKHVELLEFFKALFEIFYKGHKDSFDWQKFKKTAIIRDKCDDFIVRLVNYDYATLTTEQQASIARIKDDKYINKYASEDPNGENILDLLDYLEFVPEAAKTQAALIELDREIKKITLEGPTRKVKGLYLKNKVDNLTSDMEYLKACNDKYSEIFNEFEEIDGKFRGQHYAYQTHREEFNKKVVEEYERVRNVPSNIY